MDKTFGITIDEETTPTYEYIVNRLNEYNLAYLHISGFTIQETVDPMKIVLETAKHYRHLYNGSLIINKGFGKDTANQAIEDGITDMVSFGELYIANPDLVERFTTNVPLTKPDRSKYYAFAEGSSGYTDYSFSKV